MELPGSSDQRAGGISFRPLSRFRAVSSISTRELLRRLRTFYPVSRKPMNRRRHTIALVLLIGVVSGADTGNQTRVSVGIQFGSSEACRGDTKPLEPTGVCILGTRPDGAAERAGIRAGDVLQHLGTTHIESAAELLDAVRSLKIGDRPPAVVWRQGGPLTFTLEITAQDLGPAVPNQPTTTLPVDPPQPYRIHPLPVDTSALLGKVRDVDTALWVDADVLNVVHRDTRDGVVIGGTFQLPMNRIPGTDVWVLQLAMKGWNRTFFSYNFFAPGAIHGTVPKPEYFRGLDAIEFPVTQENLRGVVYEKTLRSRFLDEVRKITVYVPPGAKRRGMHALFMADGLAAVEFARVVEPLIAAGRTAPFAIVGVHAAQSQPSIGDAFFDVSRDRRSQEYLIGIAPDAYARHMRFFVEEVIPWASREFGISTAREDRAVIGFSSGAAFAAAIAVQHPNVFATSLPFSIGVRELPARSIGALPHFHLVAGELEPDFLASTQALRETLAGWGADVTLDVYPSGHDQLMWRTGLARLMPRVFPPRRR
jgi:enterochelin esterase-like enzyme